MTMAAVHASLSHLVSGQDRNKTAISNAIDSVVSSHQHGGKDAFDDRVTDLRAAIDSVFATMDAIHDTARTAAGMPFEPKAETPVSHVVVGEDQPVEDVAVRRARVSRTSPAEGE